MNFKHIAVCAAHGTFTRTLSYRAEVLGCKPCASSCLVQNVSATKDTAEDLRDAQPEELGANLPMAHPQLAQQAAPQVGSGLARHISLSISSKPPLKWAKQDAMRELLQNALDGEDDGHQMTTHYNPVLEELTLSNADLALSLSVLVSGGGTKAGTGARGRHHTGLKDAIQVFLSLGERLSITSGGRCWTFEEEVGLFEVPTVRVVEVDADNDGWTRVRCQLTPEEWEETQSRCLALRKPHHSYESDGGDLILFDDYHQNRLYTRDLYVCQAPEDYQFGYNLSRLELDRDRRACEPYAVRYLVADLVHAGVTAGALEAEEVRKLLEAPKGEVSSVQTYAYTGGLGQGAFHQEALRQFKEAHGLEAVPVSEPSETREAEQLGLTPISVAPITKDLLVQACAELDLDRLANSREILRVEALEGEVLDFLKNLLPDYAFQIVSFRGSVVKAKLEGNLFSLSKTSAENFELALKALASAHDKPIELLVFLILRLKSLPTTPPPLFDQESIPF